MADTPLLIIEHAGKSYLKNMDTRGYSATFTNLEVNGHRDLPAAPGDSAFLMCDDAPVQTVDRIIPAKQITTKYELRSDLRGSTKSDIISVDQYKALSDTDQSLYEAVREELPERLEPVPFVIQRKDGSPTLLPKGVVCLNRNYFSVAPSFWHLGPVQATRRYVLSKIAERLEEIFQGNPYVKRSTLFSSPEEIINGKFCDSVAVQPIAMDMNGVEVNANLRTWFSIDRERANRLNYVNYVNPVDGDNLADLEIKVSAYVEKLVSRVTAWAKPNECPCCKRRFTRSKNPVKPRTRK